MEVICALIEARAPFDVNDGDADDGAAALKEDDDDDDDSKEEDGEVVPTTDSEKWQWN